MVALVGGDCSGRGVVGAGCCHLGGGKGGRWPTNVGPAVGLRGALLGGWAEPATHGCDSLATSGSGHLATLPILTTHPWPAVPFDAHGWPLASLQCCNGSAAHGCPSNCPMPCWVTPVGELAEWPEAPKLQWPKAGGGDGEGGVAGTPPRPCQPMPAMALPNPMLTPAK